nr:PREDICTED: ubiquinol-cytochrome-c reductase complex assembly factor 1 [Bemisia tabaci]
MSLTALFTRNCCCSSAMLTLMWRQSSLVQQTADLILSRPLATPMRGYSACSNLSLLRKKVIGRTNSTAMLSSRLLATNTPTSHESQSSAYQPKRDQEVVQPAREEDSAFKKKVKDIVLNKLSFITKTHLKQARAAIIYQQLSENIQYKDFFDAFNMPDTFQSWFVVIELHLWILSARLMAEGKEGKALRDSVVAAMWEDVRARAKTIHPNTKQLNTSIQELSGQMNAAFLGYDEALLDDKILASALWRRFFNKICEDPRQLESMVSFTRHQLQLFDSLTREELIEQQKMILLRLSH